MLSCTLSADLTLSCALRSALGAKDVVATEIAELKRREQAELAAALGLSERQSHLFGMSELSQSDIAEVGGR